MIKLNWIFYFSLLTLAISLSFCEEQKHEAVQGNVSYDDESERNFEMKNNVEMKDQKTKSYSQDKFDHKQEYSPKLRHIFSKYLNTKNPNLNCNPKPGTVSTITNKDLNEAIEEADKWINKFIENDKKIIAENPQLLQFSPYIYEAELNAKYNEYVTQALVNNKCLNKEETILKLSYLQIPDGFWDIYKFCDIDSDINLVVKCDPHYKYRREDGKCNNLMNTNWGSSYRCQRRLLPPDYRDGLSQPRAAADGSALPNERLLSARLMPDVKHLDSERTNLHMSWGQYLVHDTFKTLQYWGFGINCCGLTHEECFEARDVPQDIFTRAFNQTCLNFVRSLGCNTCSIGHREQINAATHVMDLSNLYGGNNNNSEFTRKFKNGEILNMKAIDGSDTLPNASIPHDNDPIDALICSPPPDRPWLTCLLTGDGIRGNQQPMILALHTIMNRRHNSHAKALSKVNPHWDDEKLYQESKRILIAENQKINFDEYLPSVINQQLIDYYDLKVLKDGFTHYNPEVNPNILQSVGVAAFRFGHSQIQSRFQVIKKPKYESYGFLMREKFFNPIDIWEGSANGIIAGACAVPSRAVDPFIVTDVQQFLYFGRNIPVVADLAAANIARGRDHGVPGYVYYVEYCTGVELKKWEDFVQFIPEDFVKKMAIYYKHPNDVDLWLGGLAERHMNSSAVGPTFACLLAIQFHHWKFGDRFYFEHGRQAGSFTEEQLNDIRKKTSLAQLLCKTTDFDSLQSYPMLLPSKTNTKIECRNTPELDYNLWQDKQYCDAYCQSLKKVSDQGVEQTNS